MITENDIIEILKDQTGMTDTGYSRDINYRDMVDIAKAILDKINEKEKEDKIIEGIYNKLLEENADLKLQLADTLGRFEGEMDLNTKVMKENAELKATVNDRIKQIRLLVKNKRELEAKLILRNGRILELEEQIKYLDGVSMLNEDLIRENDKFKRQIADEILNDKHIDCYSKDGEIIKGEEL